jgi:hypothetical protein
MDVTADRPTVSELLARMDDSWAAFARRVRELPSQRLGDRLGDGGWTRKQMLAHIAVWHDLTADRLAEFADSGTPVELDEDDQVINARAARQAVGRSGGEVVAALDQSYRRLRREVARLTDEQLLAERSWATMVIRANTDRHYAEHAADLDARIGAT